MIAIRMLVVFAMLGCSTGNAVHASCTWDACLRQGRSQACECLSTRISACSGTGCPTGIAPTSEEVGWLIASIRPGARQEVRLAFDALHIVDGGDLEDLMRALSSLTATDPRLLLEIIRENNWEAERIKTLVRMLPLDTVDEPAKRVSLIRQRLAAVQGVHDANLSAIRAITVDALQEYEAQMLR
jgi:hypothetical protein